MKTCFSTIVLQLLLFATFLSGSAFANKCSTKCWEKAIADTECSPAISGGNNECLCGTYDKCINACHQQHPGHGEAPPGSNSCLEMLALHDTEDAKLDVKRVVVRNRRRASPAPQPAPAPVAERDIEALKAARTATKGWENHCGYPGSVCAIAEDSENAKVAQVVPVAEAKATDASDAA